MAVWVVVVLALLAFWSWQRADVETYIPKVKKCKLTHYTPDINQNDGYTTTNDQMDLWEAAKLGNTVAVPIEQWDRLKGRYVMIGNKEYKIRDSCTVCQSRKVDYDVLVGSRELGLKKSNELANRLGVRWIPCSKPYAKLPLRTKYPTK